MTFRSPSSIEKYNICRNCTDTYSNFAVTAHYNHHISKPLLANALMVLIKKFPIFSNGVVKLHGTGVDDDIKWGYGNYGITNVDEIKFNDVVTIIDEPFGEHQLTYINKIRCLPNENKPVWRVILFSSNHLTFLNDHMLLDGESGRNFHVELCKIFHDLRDAQYVDQLYSNNQVTIPPSTETYLDLYHYNYWHMVKGLCWHFLPNFMQHWYNRLTVAYYPNLSTYPLFSVARKKTINTNFNIIDIGNDKMVELLNILKFNGVTLTSFLNVYINYCLQNTILPTFSRQLLSTRAQLPISGRRYYPNTDDLSFRYMVTSVGVDLEPITKLDDNWFPRMKAINHQINQALSSRWYFKLFGLIGLSNPYHFVKPYHDGECNVLFEISNLGFSTIQAGDWQVDDLFFSQCIGVSPTFGFSVASTAKGMNIVFSHLDEFKHYPIDKFIEFFNENLDMFITTHRS